MKSETIRKNLESTIEVSWTEFIECQAVDKVKHFESNELDKAMRFARRKEKENLNQITYLLLELLVLNMSEEENNVVYRQEIPFNV